MAEVKLNALIDSVSGKVGKNAVMRRRGGRTMLTSMPTPSLEVSVKQKEQRSRFQSAVRFAKKMMLIPDAKEEYAASVKGDDFQTAFTAAVADFLNPPGIDQIILDNYSGNAGEVITILSDKDYKLMTVKVAIYLPDGTLVESGDAFSLYSTRSEWQYVTTVPVAVTDRCKIVVTAKDRANQEVIFQQEV